MAANGPCFSLRTLSITAAMTGMLGACAAPSADERAMHMDLRYGKACSAVAPESASPKYRECVTKAYETDKQRAIAQYNVDHGKTGAGLLLLRR